MVNVGKYSIHGSCGSLIIWPALFSCFFLCIWWYFLELLKNITLICLSDIMINRLTGGWCDLPLSDPFFLGGWNLMHILFFSGCMKFGLVSYHDPVLHETVLNNLWDLLETQQLDFFQQIFVEIAQEIVVSFGITWKLVVPTKVEGMD